MKEFGKVASGFIDTAPEIEDELRLQFDNYDEFGRCDSGDYEDMPNDVEELLRETAKQECNFQACCHSSKKEVTFNTFKYWYCPDCKQELK